MTQKLNSGTSSMSANQIATIIRSCAKAKVSQIKIGDIEIRFDRILAAHLDEKVDCLVPQTNVVEPELREEQISLLDEIEETQMKIENPYEYEHLQGLAADGQIDQSSQSNLQGRGTS